jgi:hypothetical protein
MNKTYIELQKQKYDEAQNGPSQESLVRKAQHARLKTQKAILDTQEALSVSERQLHESLIADEFSPADVIKLQEEVSGFKLGLSALQNLQTSLFKDLDAIEALS